MRGLFRDLAFGLRILAEEPRGTALVAVGSVLAGTLSLAVWTHIDQAVLGCAEPVAVGEVYAVTAPPGSPARAVFWSEPASSLTGACRAHASATASHIDDRSFWLERLDWSPRAAPAAPPLNDTRTEDQQESQLSPCQLEA